MEIPFVKISPTQNITILVTAPVPRERQPEVAAGLLAYDSVGGEQVGFLEAPTLPRAHMRLQMMGGEFCGNATMSAGAYLAWKSGVRDGTVDYMLEVSGASGLVPCRIEREGNLFRGTVHMPLPEGFAEVELETDHGPLRVPMVKMPGIFHVILPADTGVERAEIERRIRSWSEVVQAEALGILRYDEAGQSMEPIVYVPATDSAVWEHGCGSGTAALSSWKAWSTRQSFRGEIRQPGGTIGAAADYANGIITNLSITGVVKIAASGVAYL